MVCKRFSKNPTSLIIRDCGCYMGSTWSSYRYLDFVDIGKRLLLTPTPLTFSITPATCWMTPWRWSEPGMGRISTQTPRNSKTRWHPNQTEAIVAGHETLEDFRYSGEPLNRHWRDTEDVWVSKGRELTDRAAQSHGRSIPSNKRYTSIRLLCYTII